MGLKSVKSGKLISVVSRNGNILQMDRSSRCLNVPGKIITGALEGNSEHCIIFLPEKLMPGEAFVVIPRAIVEERGQRLTVFEGERIYRFLIEKSLCQEVG